MYILIETVNIGAGIAALMGDIKVGGRIEATPISLIISTILSAYVLFSVSFKYISQHNRFAKMIANLGMISGDVNRDDYRLGS